MLCLCTTQVYAENTPQEVASSETEVDIPSTPHDANAPTLAELQAPNESELSQANTELLAKNAELQGRIDELTTQVNVLVNERSGQLFLYGAVSTFMSFMAGFVLAWVFIQKKK